MQEKIYLIGNWKMNKLPGDVLAFFDKYTTNLRKYINEKKEKKDIKISTLDKIESIFAVPYINMFYANLYANEEKRIKIGAQNVFYKDLGSHTGEIAPVMLKSIDVLYSIVGHSERRANGEKSEEIKEKIKALLDQNMTAVFCIGETEEEEKAGKTKAVIKKQIEEVLKDKDFEDPKKQEKIIVAYEPIWAIGTGKSCDENKAKENIEYIKEVLANLGFKNTPVLYGGSVNSENAKSYLETKSIDGLLIGGASLKPNDFLKIYISTAKYLQEN